MGLLERFMGQPDPEEPFTQLVANPLIKRPLSFQLLFMGPLDLDGDAIALALQSYHPDLSRAQAELTELPPEEDARENAQSLLGLAGWKNHVVKIIGFDTPLPEPIFEACVRPAHFHEQLKADAREHRSHALLFYAGHETDPLEQYVALTAVAAALARFDAILVLNEAARSAFPAEALLADDPDQDRLEQLRGLPIPLLYGGFIKVEVEGQEGVWMRTFGNTLLHLPDLAMWRADHAEGSETFELFANILAYLRESGSQFAPGHTMQIGPGTYLRLRKAHEEEWWLKSDGEMFIAEQIGADEIHS